MRQITLLSHFAFIFCLWLLFSLGFGLSFAQSLTSDDIEIHAEQHLEWDKQGQRYIAEGGVVVKGKEFTVNSDRVTAFYRETSDSKQDIYLLRAEGNVIISRAGVVFYGDSAVYEGRRSLIVLKGEDVRLDFKGYRLRADDSIEYWHDEGLAVAREKVTISRAGQVLSATIIEAEIVIVDGVLEIENAVAKSDVVFNDGETVIRGNEGHYDSRKHSSIICGDVEITRGDNQIHGHCAEIDLRTGTAKLKAAGDERVSGSIILE